MRQWITASCEACGETEVFRGHEVGELEAWEDQHADAHAQRTYERAQRELDERGME